VKLRQALQITAATVGIIAASIGVNVYWQYRTAPPPALDSMPTYTSAVPVTDIPETERADAETKMRNLASTAQPGYRVAGERFLATSVVRFVWDALRHDVESCLGPRSYILDKDGWSADYTIVYHVYGHDGGLRRKFNADKILVAGLTKTPMRTVTGDNVYLYGYFRLTPS
jgi:hypothetical protein